MKPWFLTPLALLAFSFDCHTPGEQTPTPAEQTSTPATPPEETPVDESPTPPPPAEGLPVADSACTGGRIVPLHYVVDGDTVELNLKSNGEYERVRLISVDTPEVYGEVECYGPEASSFTHSALDYEDALCLTYDPAITAESDNIDPYGRTLAYLFYGPDFSHFLNAELLSGGYAEAAFYTDNTEFEGYFRTLEDWAQGYELGMWGACY